jgi:GT2 family glycosyltransferase
MIPDIGIVTVLYNSESVLEDFFNSLGKQTFTHFKLYVVDNKSPDGSLELCKKLSGNYSFKTIVIENSNNDGVAKGNNLGIQRALADDCDYILLSNNDVTFEPKTIELLVQDCLREKASMAVPKIYYHGTDLIWAAGGYIQKWSGLVKHYGEKQRDEGQFDCNKLIPYAPTCFMLIDKNVFVRNGLMDERYFVYWDDTDFVYRSIRNGETLWYFHQPKISHKESTSTGFMSDFSIRYLTRNSVYFALKNYSLVYAYYVIFVNIAFHLTVLFFKWPFNQWTLKLKSYKEGFRLFRSSRL